MKSFAAISAVAALASVASAQVSGFNQQTQTWFCPKPDAAYCAGTEVTNIIIFCTGTVGRGTNCNDVLAFEPPQGTLFAPCIQSSAEAGDASCSKDGIVYAGYIAGHGPNTTFPVPANASTSLPLVSTIALTSSTSLPVVTPLTATSVAGAAKPTSVGTTVSPVSSPTGSLLPVTNAAAGTGSLSVVGGIAAIAAALFAGLL